jgi:hypothetical protein
MPLHDYFVGFVAAVLGCFFLLGAVLDGRWLMALGWPRRLTEMIGKTAARWMLGAIGLGLIVLGGAIASGWRVNWF